MDKTEDARLRRWFEAQLKTTSTVTMTITPVLAKIMLEKNTANRNLSSMQLRLLVADMRAGAWQLTGEAIIFSNEGTLNNGQHRLTACIQADADFVTNVTFGIDRAAFAVTDRGLIRKVGDVFGMNGEVHPHRLAAGLNALAMILNNGKQGRKMTLPEAAKYLAAHPGIRESLTPCDGWYKSRLIEPSISIALHYLCSKASDRATADGFFTYICEGHSAVYLLRDDPRHVLRERLIANKGNRSSLSKVEVAALVIKAWNAFRAGKAVRGLKWATTVAKGKTPESFPVVS